jgi:hypothetical protein
MQHAVDKLPKSAGVRQNEGMHGQMFPIGEHWYNEAKEWKEYAATGKLRRLLERGGHDMETLQDFMMNYRMLMAECQPAVLQSMNQNAQHYGVKNSEIMAGRKGVTPSLMITKDLANPPHYDPLDLGPSFCIWTEKDECGSKNWNFVFPQLVIKVDDVTYEGLIIRLTHGCYIQWDGRLRHCTTLTEQESNVNNAVYGWYVGNNHRSLKFYDDANGAKKNTEKNMMHSN